MKCIHSSVVLLAACFGLILAAEDAKPRRQAAMVTSMKLDNGAMSAATASMSGGNADGKAIESVVSEPKLSRVSPKVTAAKPAPSDRADDERDEAVEEEEELEEHLTRRRPQRRFRERQGHRANSHRQYEDYADEDYDDGGNFGKFFVMNPMRHFSRIMGDMMSQMPFPNGGGPIMMGGGGGNSAVASSYSSSDGYSKMRSSVTNQGRTSGIMSETRNGRTVTRRFGEDPEDEGGN